MSAPVESLDAWVRRQYRRSLTGLLAGVSPLALTKRRPGFGQIIRPRRGAIVASPILAAYDPDPDYFFHWYRDSALVIDALRIAYQDGIVGPEAPGHLADFVEFNLALRALDGGALADSPGWRAAVAADFQQYLRTDEELRTVRDETVGADTRVNADGTLDISRWARPQHDGPALRALALLRWWGVIAAPASASRQLTGSQLEALSQLLQEDLAYVCHHAREACFDIWEEEHGLHYYTVRVSAAALEQGAAWLAIRPGHSRAADVSSWQAQARALLAQLDEFWLPAEGSAGHGYYRSRRLSSGERSAKELDISVILAPLHAGAAHGAHSCQDPRIHATLARLEQLFDAAYPINRQRAALRGPALGRYADDRYYSGGAYYFATLAAAELCYRAAAATSGGSRTDLRSRGDAFLKTVRAFTPADGQLSEQFDQRTGEQTSAKELGWSHAAFISCVHARAVARGGTGPAGSGTRPAGGGTGRLARHPTGK